MKREANSGNTFLDCTIRVCNTVWRARSLRTLPRMQCGLQQPTLHSHFASSLLN